MTRKPDPGSDAQPTRSLAKSPADGRFHLLPEEIDEHTRQAARLVFDPASLDGVLAGESSRILAPTLGEEVLTLGFASIKTRSADSHTLQGHVLGEEDTSLVQIVYHDGIIHGSVVRYDRHEELEYRILADGHMMVRQLDHSTMTGGCATCEGELMADVVDETAVDGSPWDGASDEPISRDTAGWRTIDVTVGYTVEARLADGGYPQIEARIIASVDRMTLAFANSAIADTELMLLGTIEDPDYVENSSSRIYDAHTKLRNLTDGELDAVTDFHDQLGSDLASIITSAGQGGVAGVAVSGSWSSANARTQMTSGQMTFEHELGHNLGCAHAWGDTSEGNTESNMGWRFQGTSGTRYSTIMAYTTGWAGRIPYFSNPNVLHPDGNVPMGCVDGYDATNDPTVDPALKPGYNGSVATRGADNARVIDIGEGGASNGASAAVARGVRADFEALEPKPADRWEKGTTRTISFNGGDMEDLATIKLYKGGVPHTTLASGVNPATHRNFAWQIPYGLPDGTDYMIRVELTSHGSTTFADSGLFEIYSDLPHVNTASAPAVPPVIGQVSSVILTFNVPMNPATFVAGADVVSFINPEGTSLLGSITSAAWSAGDTVLTIQFSPPSLQGSYQMVIGPDIEDAAGNRMDQDGDGTTGESVEDRYTTTFQVNPPLIRYDNMDSDPGYAFSGNNPSYGWKFGQPTGGTGPSDGTSYPTQYGIADPTSGFNGPNVIGYNLNGDYERGITSTRWATTPAMDCSNYENVRLRFQRWLGIYYGSSTPGGSSGDNAHIQVSNDGTNWTLVWHNTNSRLTSTGWVEVEYDISAVADGQSTVYVRWGMGNTNTSANDDSCGWNIDEVIVHGDYVDDADDTPPYPNPLTFSTPPTALGVSAITMTASTALDANGVEYLFDETSGNPGGTDSGWQDSPGYTDTGLQAGTQYTYTVRARDKSPGQNETTPSAAAATTDAGPTLTVVIAAADIGESDGSAATTATVSRNTDTSGSLLVNLSSSDTTEVTVPASVTIAAGQSSSAPFNLNAVDDAILDGTQTVTLTATAAAHTSGMDTIDVTDDAPITLTVITGANGQSTGGGGLKDPDGSPYAITATPATGYGFGQWIVVSGEATIDNDTQASTAVDTIGDATVQANFAVGSYPVTYLGNGSDGGSAPLDASSPYDYNTTVTVLGNTGALTRTGHSFGGWNTASDGSGTPYAAGNTFNIAADTTLFAQWNPDTYTISYHGNGNTAGTVPGSQTKTYGETLTLASNSGDLVKEGHTFEGWNTASDGSGTDYPEEGSFNTEASTTLYAKWNAAPAVDAGADQTIYLSAAEPWSPDDIPLVAWYDAADTGTILESGGAVSQWSDKYGNRHATQTTVLRKPMSGVKNINGKNAIDFEVANTQFLNMPVVDVIGKEVWAAFTLDSYASTTSQLLLGAGGGNVQIGVNSSTGKLRLWASTNPYSADTVSTATVPAATPTIAGWLAHTDTKKFSIHGVLETTNNTYVSPRTLSPNFIGRGQYNYMDGAIGEIIITGGPLSLQDRQRMEGYLAHKWGTATSLPDGHPHENAPPGAPPAVAALDATVEDAEGDLPTLQWTKVAGPSGAVNFTNATSADTSASFAEPGTYTLRLTADDGLQQTHDDVVITVSLPPLGVSITEASIPENGGSTSATISRSGSSGALVVSLASSDPGAATVPATATIPDGQSSVNVTVSAVDDLTVNGTRTVTITASATGYADGADSLDLLDNETANNFASWMAGYDVGEDTGLDDDHDHDGIPNALENHFGTDPSISSPGLTDMELVAGANMTFRFKHPLNDEPAADLTAAYRWSKDLTTFYPSGESDPAGTIVTFATSPPVEGVVTVTATLTGSPTERVFVTVEVTQE